MTPRRGTALVAGQDAEAGRTDRRARPAGIPPGGTGSSPATAPSTPLTSKPGSTPLLLEVIDALASLFTSHDNGNS